MSGQVLQQLRCPGCDAPAVLVDADETPCAHCGAAVPIASNYRAAYTAAIALDDARKAVEPLWQRLARPPSYLLGGVGYLLVFFLPILATLLASVLPSPPMPRAEIYAAVTLPALVPGMCLVAWQSLVAATVMRFREALSSRPPASDGGSPRCRTCSAELQVPESAVAVTCPYCETDNLATPAQHAAVHEDLGRQLVSLADATVKMRTRRVGLALSVIGVALLVGGGSAVLWIASV